MSLLTSLLSALVLSAPLTGDKRNIILYVILAVVALVLIVAFVLLGKKSKK